MTGDNLNTFNLQMLAKKLQCHSYLREALVYTHGQTLIKKRLFSFVPSLDEEMS